MQKFNMTTPLMCLVAVVNNRQSGHQIAAVNHSRAADHQKRGKLMCERIFDLVVKTTFLPGVNVSHRSGFDSARCMGIQVF
jgi:hypothetical protein